MSLIGAGPSGSLPHPPLLYQGEQPLGAGTRGGGRLLQVQSSGLDEHLWAETHPICVSAHRSSLPKVRCPEN